MPEVTLHKHRRHYECYVQHAKVTITWYNTGHVSVRVRVPVDHPSVPVWVNGRPVRFDEIWKYDSLDKYIGYNVINLGELGGSFWVESDNAGVYISCK